MSLVNREMVSPDEALEKAQDPNLMREKFVQLGMKLKEL
jgi:twitching motility protein PilT